jgi:mannan endo-1,4-beta-mannosidase
MMRRTGTHLLVLLSILAALALPWGHRLLVPDNLETWDAPIPPSSSLTDLRRFVTARGNELYVGDRPFRFVGFNLFDAAGRPDGYHCAWWGALSDAELDAALGRMRSEAGATVLRFWAFQSYTTGGTDWTGIDRVVRLAKKHDMRVIPTLENGMPHCTEGGPSRIDGGQWYAEAHRRTYRHGYPLSFPDYAERLVTRYRDEPAILGWMIMNEAETDNVNGLYTFAREMSALIKRTDPNHLVTLGTQSSGQPGARGQDFIRLYSLESLDFVSGHDWDYWGDDRNPLPGSPDRHDLPNPATCSNYRAISCSVAQSLSILNKPFVISEAGIKAWPMGLYSSRQRAALLGAKMDAALANGVSGYLIWQWGKVIDEGYDILWDDPLLLVLRQRAARLWFGMPILRPGDEIAGQVPRTQSRVEPRGAR